jgi:hypothetical protein
MAFPEVYTALEQRVVDGQENPYPTILGNKFQEVQKFVSETEHIYNVQSLLMSKKGVWPFMLAPLVVLFLMVLFPVLVTWPAKLIGG